MKDTDPMDWYFNWTIDQPCENFAEVEKSVEQVYSRIPMTHTP